MIPFIYKITRALDEAFDCVDHSILLRKLYVVYGIRINMHDWFKIYLSNRKQIAAINDSFSSTKNITYGVFQGIILEPLFFVLYVNDLHKALNKTDCILFADDTNTFAKHKNYKQVIDIMNSELNS